MSPLATKVASKKKKPSAPTPASRRHLQRGRGVLHAQAEHHRHHAWDGAHPFVAATHGFTSDFLWRHLNLDGHLLVQLSSATIQTAAGPNATLPAAVRCELEEVRVRRERRARAGPALDAVEDGGAGGAHLAPRQRRHRQRVVALACVARAGLRAADVRRELEGRWSGAARRELHGACRAAAPARSACGSSRRAASASSAAASR